MSTITKSPTEQIEKLELDNHYDRCTIVAYDTMEENKIENLEEIIEDYNQQIRKRERGIERIKEGLGPDKEPVPEEQEGVETELVLIKKSVSHADDLMADLDDDDFADDVGEP